MIALARFQVSAYLRSQRVLQPVLVIVLLIVLVLRDWPAESVRAPSLIAGSFGDTAAFLIPLGAWATRALLDTEPDVQRELSVLAIGRRSTAALAGLLAGYALTLALSAMLLLFPVLQAIDLRVGPRVVLNGVGLHLLAAAAATAFGAWTSRAILPSSAMSLLAMVGGSVFLLLLSMGPLNVISVPMIGWLRATHHGPAAFAAAFPGLVLHLTIWIALVATGYVLVRMIRH